MKNQDDISIVNVPGYEIIRMLGEGADGITYQARHEILGEVKIKIFKDPESKIKKAIEQEGISLEDRIKRRVSIFDKQVRNNKNITKLYSCGRCKNPRTGDETIYIVSDYVDGGAVEVKENGIYKIRDDINAWWDFYPIFYRLLSGLEAIHEGGLILKDIKLSNLLVSYDHQTILIDDLETIAQIEEVQSGVRPTEGSDRYAAPEVMVDIKNSSVHSDLYSAVACFLSMASGNPGIMKDLNTITDEEVYYKRMKSLIMDDSTYRDPGVVDAIRKLWLEMGLNFHPKVRGDVRNFKEKFFGSLGEETFDELSVDTHMDLLAKYGKNNGNEAYIEEFMARVIKPKRQRRDY